jgi:hypothetical protein
VVGESPTADRRVLRGRHRLRLEVRERSTREVEGGGSKERKEAGGDEVIVSEGKEGRLSFLSPLSLAIRRTSEVETI